jgi:hypothetical protein
MTYGLKCSKCEKIIPLEKDHYVRIPPEFKFVCPKCFKKIDKKEIEDKFELEIGTLIKQLDY